MKGKRLWNEYVRYDLVSLVEFFSSLVFILPRIRLFNWIKGAYLRWFFGAKVGRRVVFYPGIWIFTGRGLVIGDDVDLARGVLITTGGGVSIGARVLVGYGAQIISANHNVPEGRGRIFESGHTLSPVIIEDDVWIGANAVILPGVKIGEGAVVGAGSVVTRDVPPFVFVGGVPARVLKARG